MNFQITQFIEYQIYCKACGEVVENQDAVAFDDADIFDSSEDAIKAATKQGFKPFQSGTISFNLCGTCAKDLDASVPKALKAIELENK